MSELRLRVAAESQRVELSLHLLRGDARVAELGLGGVAEAEGLHVRHHDVAEWGPGGGGSGS
eukprot:3543534-Rhodomonas_salina.1